MLRVLILLAQHTHRQCRHRLSSSFHALCHRIDVSARHTYALSPTPPPIPPPPATLILFSDTFRPCTSILTTSLRGIITNPTYLPSKFTLSGGESRNSSVFARRTLSCESVPANVPRKMRPSDVVIRNVSRRRFFSSWTGLGSTVVVMGGGCGERLLRPWVRTR